MSGCSEAQNVYIITWAIQNFSCNVKQSRECIDSPEFSENATYGPKWTLKIYPKGLEDDAYVSFALHKKPEDTTNNISVGYSVSIIASDNSVQFSNEVNPAVFDVDTTLSSVPYFVERADLKEQPFLLFMDTLRIQCVIKRPIVQHSAYTRIPAEILSFPWCISNFSLIELDDDQLIYPLNIGFPKAPHLTLRFGLDGESFSEAYIKIDCLKESKFKDRFVSENKKQPSYYARNPFYDDCTCWLLFRISIQDVKGNACCPLECEHKFKISEEEEVYDLPPLAMRKDIIRNGNKLLPDDQLNLCIELKITNGSKESLPIELKSGYPSHQPFKTLTTYKNWREKKFCDVILKTANERFFVHKDVLCHHSPVFRDTFDFMKTKNVLEVTDMDYETLEALLLFMYTSALDESQNYANVEKLYVAANQYKVTSLKNACAFSIISKISARNLDRIIVLSFKYEDKSLEEAANAFISKSHRKPIGSE